MGRHLSTLGTSLSALLLVAVCVLWVQSYWPSEPIHLQENKKVMWTVASEFGVLIVVRNEDPAPEKPPREIDWNFSGFKRLRITFTIGSWVGEPPPLTLVDLVAVPYWFLAPLAGAAPAMWLRATV